VTHLNLPSEPRLDLNCLVVEDDISAARVFPVKIARSETVGGLKDAIKDKKKHAFDGVDADRLDLWKVSIPDDRSLKENISKLKFDDEQSLSPMKELLEVFSESPARKHLHIVVRAPPAGELDNFLHE
jgi:Crinkler effector protein N-terminal domain